MKFFERKQRPLRMVGKKSKDTTPTLTISSTDSHISTANPKFPKRGSKPALPPLQIHDLNLPSSSLDRSFFRFDSGPTSSNTSVENSLITPVDGSFPVKTVVDHTFTSVFSSESSCVEANEVQTLKPRMSPDNLTSKTQLHDTQSIFSANKFAFPVMQTLQDVLIPTSTVTQPETDLSSPLSTKRRSIREERVASFISFSSLPSSYGLGFIFDSDTSSAVSTISTDKAYTDDKEEYTMSSTDACGNSNYPSPILPDICSTSTPLVSVCLAPLAQVYLSPNPAFQDTLSSNIASVGQTTYTALTSPEFCLPSTTFQFSPLLNGQAPSLSSPSGFSILKYPLSPRKAAGVVYSPQALSIVSRDSGRQFGAQATLGPYILFGTLGCGTYGKVFLGYGEDEYRSGRVSDGLVAIKLMRKRRMGDVEVVKEVRRELDVLRMVSERAEDNVNALRPEERDMSVNFLQQMVRSFQDEDHVYLVLEYHPTPLSEMSILARLRPDAVDITLEGHVSPTHSALLLTAAELVLGLLFLHARGIIHHDLKPNNVMVSAAGHIVITDFGANRFLPILSPRSISSSCPEIYGSNSRASGPFGRIYVRPNETLTYTAYYAAPELINTISGGGVEYDERIDFWALGVLLYNVLSDTMPFSVLPGFGGHDKLWTKAVRSGVLDLRAIEGEETEQIVLRAFISELLAINPDKRLHGRGIVSHKFFAPLSDLWGEISDLRHPPFPDPSPSRLRHDMSLEFDDSTGGRSTTGVEEDASLSDVARMFREQRVDVTWPKILSGNYEVSADEDSDLYEDAMSEKYVGGEDDDFVARRMEALLVSRTGGTLPSESGLSESTSCIGEHGDSGLGQRDARRLSKSPNIRNSSRCPVSRIGCSRTTSSVGSRFFEEVDIDRAQPLGSPLAGYYEKFNVVTEASSTPISEIVQLSDLHSFIDLESPHGSPAFKEYEFIQSAPFSPVSSPVPSIGRLSISGAISIHSLALNIEEHLYLVDADASSALFANNSVSSPTPSPNTSFIRSPTNLSGLFSFYSPRLGTITEEAIAKPQQCKVNWHASTYERPLTPDRTLRRAQRTSIPLNPNRQTIAKGPLVISQPFALIAKPRNTLRHALDNQYSTMAYEGAHTDYRHSHGSTTPRLPLPQPKFKRAISLLASKVSKGFKKTFTCSCGSLDNIE